jgi:hypothetical protein
MEGGVRSEEGVEEGVGEELMREEGGRREEGGSGE